MFEEPSAEGPLAGEFSQQGEDQHQDAKQPSESETLDSRLLEETIVFQYHALQGDQAGIKPQGLMP